MRMRYTRRILCCLLMILTILNLCSCSKKDEPSDVRTGGYRVVSAEISAIEGYQADTRKVLCYGSSYYVQVGYSDGIKGISKVYIYSKTGELINTFETEEHYSISFIKDDKIYAQNGSRGVATLDRNSGSLLDSFRVDDDIMAIAPAADGYVICGLNSIARYSFDNNKVSSISIDGMEGYGRIPYFEVEDKEYLVLGDNTYYTLDFDSKEAKLLKTPGDVRIDPDECYGSYILDRSGGYKLELETFERTELLRWGDIDIKPYTKILKNQSKYYVFGDDELAVVYDYLDNSQEVIFVSYDENCKDERERIVIGGFRTVDDIALKLSVYDYNMSQDKYRAVIEDYSDLFGSTDGYDAEKQNLKLTKYFDEGHTPDMFCGLDFDYQVWGRNNVVKDIMPLAEKYAPDLFDGITPNIKKAMSAGDKCYAVLTSYALEGCFGKAADLTGNDITIFDLDKAKRDSNKHIYDSMYHYDIADSVMERVLDGRRRGAGTENVFDKKTMESIVRFSIDNGQRLTDSLELYDPDEYLLKSTSCSSIIWFADICLNDLGGEHIAFYGDPSVKGSVHMAQPTGIIAISSSTDKDEECIKIISHMLDHDVQEKAAVIGGFIPVNEKVLDEICECAADPDKIQDESYKRYLKMNMQMIDPHGNGSVSTDIINDFRQATGQVDCIRTLDWGVFNIIYEEIASYEYQDKTVEEIAQAICSRLEVYVNENYG